MIHFTCPQCATAFHVPDSFAGRRGRCRICSTLVRAPIDQQQPRVPRVAAAASAYAGGSSDAATAVAVADSPDNWTVDARLDRLASDAKRIEQQLSDFPHIRVRSMRGQPPHIYQIEYHVNGLVRGRDGNIETRPSHLVEIQLTDDYPHLAPRCRMNTPIFHPNIDSARIDVDGFWAADEQLSGLIVRIGEMIAYQVYNITSPLDPEAAMWADLNRDQLPVDVTDLHPADFDDRPRSIRRSNPHPAPPLSPGAPQPPEPPESRGGFVVR
jgi:ubiquitin-protein ligase